MRIYFIRHADPDYEHDSLTPAGHLEAQALARRMAQMGLDEIYTSPRGRARLTAQYTADALGGLPVQVEPWTYELEGLHCAEYPETAWDVDPAVLRDPRMVSAWAAGAPLPPLHVAALAPRLAEIQSGSDDFFRRQGFTRDGVAYRFEPDAAGRASRKRIALFAHLGFGLTWLSFLLNIPLPVMWAGFYMHPSAVTTLLMDERAPGCAAPRLVGVGDITHLAQAGLPPSRAGLITNID